MLDGSFMKKGICIYASSSDMVDPVFFETADRLGRLIGRKGYALVYGGGRIGLMGVLAEGVKREGGAVIGVIPEALNLKGVVYEHCDELIVTEDMRRRKDEMDKRANAFIALPGGFGTLEELLEVITLKQLMYHDRAIAILNTDGFYDALIAQFEGSIGRRFAKEQCRELYAVCLTPESAVAYIENYRAPALETKWMTPTDAAMEAGEGS
jgi:uncharacterized protein (TIGR00730 family)